MKASYILTTILAILGLVFPIICSLVYTGKTGLGDIFHEINILGVVIIK